MIRNRSKKKIQMQFILSLSISTHPSLSVSIYFHYIYRLFFVWILSLKHAFPAFEIQTTAGKLNFGNLFAVVYHLFIFILGKTVFRPFRFWCLWAKRGSKKIARAVTQNFKLFTILDANLWNLCVYWHIFNSLKEFFFVGGRRYLSNSHIIHIMSTLYI